MRGGLCVAHVEQACSIEAVLYQAQHCRYEDRCPKNRSECALMYVLCMQGLTRAATCVSLLARRVELHSAKCTYPTEVLSRDSTSVHGWKVPH